MIIINKYDGVIFLSPSMKERESRRGKEKEGNCPSPVVCCSLLMSVTIKMLQVVYNTASWLL